MLIHAVPQWQGASWDGAESRLPPGCRELAALAAERTGADVHDVPVGDAGSPAAHGIRNRDALIANRRPQLDALEAPGTDRVFTIGGDCAADLVPAGVARYRYGERLGIVWFDAHADLNTAGSSPSGGFHGMVLRSLLGGGDPDFAASPAYGPGRAVLAGTRAFDPAERQAVADGLARHVPASADPAAVAGELRATGADRVYVHIDVDVLDPHVFTATHFHEPDGLTVDRLVAALEALAAFDVVGAAMTECSAGSRADVTALAPVVESVARLLSG